MTPMSKITPIGAMKIADPARWEREVIRAMKQAGGRLAVAAEALGVSTRQLSRWLAEYPHIPRAEPGRPWPKK